MGRPCRNLRERIIVNKYPTTRFVTRYSVRRTPRRNDLIRSPTNPRLHRFIQFFRPLFNGCTPAAKHCDGQQQSKYSIHMIDSIGANSPTSLHRLFAIPNSIFTDTRIPFTKHFWDFPIPSLFRSRHLFPHLFFPLYSLLPSLLLHRSFFFWDKLFSYSSLVAVISRRWKAALINPREN